MLALAGIPLGLSFRFLDPSPDAPAAEVGELLVAEYDDPELLDRLADGAAAVTYEFENVPVGAAERVGAIPGSAAATGTFSNSYVTAAAPSASRSRSSESSYSPTSSSPTSAAGASGEGSRNRNESPSGIPASASIRPSWPPPMTPTVAK